MGALLAGALGVVIAAIAVAAIADPDPDLMSWVGLVVLSPIAVALLWAAWAVTRAVRRRALYLHTGGLAVTDAAGRVEWWADWRDVSVHWAAIEVRKSVEHRITTPEETLLRLRLRNRHQELSRQLRRLSAKAKLSEVAERLDKGESMGLGPLVVDSAGVCHQDTVLGWPQIKKISTIQGELVIKGDSGAIRVLADEIPDLALLTMIQQS